jgi:lysylphosphatidylglycerol synthetase-like protein (DUF2156 family)
MENETYEIRKGAIVYKSRPPLDVQVVAYFLYFLGFLELAVSPFWSVPLARHAHHAPRHVLFGILTLAGGPTEAIYAFCMGAGTVFCAWGLMRRISFAWWFTVVFHIYGWVDTALSFSQWFSRSPSGMVLSIALGIAMFTWLWFRREFYGVHLAVRHKSKSG